MLASVSDLHLALVEGRSAPSPTKRSATLTAADNGTCEHCRSVGIPCEADLRGRKRPFYRVSGEVYEYSIKLLRRFVPEDQLPELTVENIQSLLERLEAGNAPSPLALPDTTSNVVASPAQAPGDGDRAKSSEVMEPDEHPLLQEELGCMLLDSMGKYRQLSHPPRPMCLFRRS